MSRLPRDHVRLDAPNIVCIAPGCRTQAGGFRVFCATHRADPLSDRSGWLARHLRAERLKRKQRLGDAEALRAHLATPEGEKTARAISDALAREPELMD